MQRNHLHNGTSIIRGLSCIHCNQQMCIHTQLQKYTYYFLSFNIFFFEEQVTLLKARCIEGQSIYRVIFGSLAALWWQRLHYSNCHRHIFDSPGLSWKGNIGVIYLLYRWWRTLVCVSMCVLVIATEHPLAKWRHVWEAGTFWVVLATSKARLRVKAWF